MTQKPKLSIVIPCYNAERYILHCLSSVWIQDAPHEEYECIIVNDGSTDSSESIALKFIHGKSLFQYISQPNRGVAAARNQGISRARGRYILPLDADDFLNAWSVRVYLETWAKNPDAALIIPQVRRFWDDNPGERIYTHLWKGYSELLNRCFLPNSCSYKKSDWERIGGYRDGTMYEDWEFWIRLLHRNDTVANAGKVLINYRDHQDSRVHEGLKNHHKECQIIREMNASIYFKKP